MGEVIVSGHHERDSACRSCVVEVDDKSDAGLSEALGPGISSSCLARSCSRLQREGSASSCSRKHRFISESKYRLRMVSSEKLFEHDASENARSNWRVNDVITSGQQQRRGLQAARWL